MADSEKTRMTNYIKKSIDIDMNNVREMADHYRNLDEISKLISKEMSILKKNLIEANVNEYFLEDEQKVVLQEGAKITGINPYKIRKDERISDSDFMRMVSISETSIKDTLKKGTEYDWDPNEIQALIESAKQFYGNKNPSVRVSKITKKELEEMA